MHIYNIWYLNCIYSTVSSYRTTIIINLIKITITLKYKSNAASLLTTYSLKEKEKESKRKKCIYKIKKRRSNLINYGS